MHRSRTLRTGSADKRPTDARVRSIGQHSRLRSRQLSARRNQRPTYTEVMARIQPTLEWYKARSVDAGSPPRCPFTSVQRCARFYQSVSLLGESGFTTAIPRAKDERLLAMWQQSDLWPSVDEQATSIMGPADDPRHLMNFCPEVLYERFGLFASSLHGYADEIDIDTAHSLLAAEHASASDWGWTWASVKPMHYTDCPLYSPLTQNGPNQLGLLSMCTEQNGRDPFRVLVGMIDDSDMLVSVALAGGLTFDAKLTDAEAYSNTTRIRALRPRVLAAYDALESAARLATALAAVEELRRLDVDMAAVAQRFRAAGWELRETGFVVLSAETREVFFPQGSPWDAFVVLRGLFTEATESITIVDAYCDTTVFQLLQGRNLDDALNLRVLCRRHAQAVAAEAEAFMGQYPNVTVHVRTTTDFHDRFIVLDGNVCIHIGASIKDAGKLACMVSRIEDVANRDAMLGQLNESWEAGTHVL